MFSCCKHSNVVEIGAPAILKPESQHWKLVCAQRLKLYFDEAAIKLPLYIQSGLELVVKMIESDKAVQETATSYQREFQSIIYKQQKQFAQKKGIIGSYLDEDEISTVNNKKSQINEDLISEELSAPALVAFNTIKAQVKSDQHPIKLIINIFSQKFVSFYSKYTGIGFQTKLQQDEKKRLFKQLIEDSQALRASAISYRSGKTEINSSFAGVNDFEFIGEEEKALSVSALATDELYLVLKTVCLMTETFYKHLLPAKPEFKDIIQSLHDDIFKLCQIVMFSNQDLHSSVLIMVRVDTQLDDKDIRRKCKQMSNFTTQDFGLSDHVQLGLQLQMNKIENALDNIQEVDEDDINETLRISNRMNDLTSSVVTSGTEQFYDCVEQPQKEEFKIKNLVNNNTIQHIKDSPQLQKYPPYSKTIKKLKDCFQSKELAPIEKLFHVKDAIQTLKTEIQEYWELLNQSDEFQIELDRSDILSILIYALAKAQISDLRAQFTMIQAFTSHSIQDGFTRLSASYSDLQNAINFISSIDKQQLAEGGAKYLQTVCVDKLVTMMYQYPDSSETGSVLTTYDMFAVGVQNRGDNSNSGYSNYSFRQLNRISNRPSFQIQRDAKSSMAGKDRKILIDINSQDEKKRAMSRRNISQNSNLNIFDQSNEGPKSLKNSSYELL